MRMFLEKYGTSLVIAFLALCAVVIAQSVNDVTEQQKMSRGFASGLIAQATQFYEVDEVSASVAYFRYSGTPDKTFIKKTVTTGTVTSNLKAFDVWSNRTTATYLPIND